MDLFDRVYRLHDLLRGARQPVSHARLERELECTRATVNRIIKRMRLYLRAPIRYDRARNGYYLARGEDGPWELPGLWFNASELHALLTAHELLRNVQPGLIEEELAPLRSRMEEILKTRRAGNANVARRVRVLRMAGRHVEPLQFRHVAEAVIRRRRLRIAYHGRASDAITEREISPQRLVHYRDNWYCDAWDHAKRALRTFALDRIRESAPLAEAVKEISDARLDTHVASAYGIFSGVPRRRAVLRFTAERARWVADEIWHPRQQARRLPDGAYELSFPYADERELVLDIARYGPDVEVVSPASLRRTVVERLRKSIERYARGKPKAGRGFRKRPSTSSSRRTGSRNEPAPSVEFNLGSSRKGNMNP